MKCFAFLYEPASYTVDRNTAVYDKHNIGYCYFKGSSKAKSSKYDIQNISVLDNFNIINKFSYIVSILKYNDIIIFNGYTGLNFIIYFILNLFFRRPTGIDSDTQFREPTNKLKVLFKRLYLNSIFKKNYYYGLAGGNFSHKDLFIKYGMNPKRVLLMPMTVNNEKFEVAYKDRNYDTIKFVYVGRLVRCKNLQFLLDTFKEFSKSCNNAELHIVGTGELENELKNKYNQESHIFFDGPKYGKDLIDTYKNNDVLVLPSSYEPWGLVVNEAMAAGLPVIVSNEVGAANDLVKDKDTGIIFQYNSKSELINAFKAMTDKDRLRQMSINAYNLMKYHWNYELYEECIINFLEVAKK